LNPQLIFKAGASWNFVRPDFLLTMCVRMPEFGCPNWVIKGLKTSNFGAA
jgi:hypothetical protein